MHKLPLSVAQRLRAVPNPPFPPTRTMYVRGPPLLPRAAAINSATSGVRCIIDIVWGIDTETGRRKGIPERADVRAAIPVHVGLNPRVARVLN